MDVEAMEVDSGGGVDDGGRDDGFGGDGGR